MTVSGRMTPGSRYLELTRAWSYAFSPSLSGQAADRFDEEGRRDLHLSSSATRQSNLVPTGEAAEGKNLAFATMHLHGISKPLMRQVAPEHPMPRTLLCTALSQSV